MPQTNPNKMQFSGITKTSFGQGIEIFGSNKKVIVDKNGVRIKDLPKETLLPKNIETMAPSERIAAANDIIKASLQYKKQITQTFLEGTLSGKDFLVNAKTGIISTMPEKCLEVFLRRMNRIKQLAEAMGYTINFTKWNKEKEYSWYFKHEWTSEQD